MVDLSHVVDYESLQLNENIQILARKMKTLGNREIALVKALWQNH